MWAHSYIPQSPFWFPLRGGEVTSVWHLVWLIVDCNHVPGADCWAGSGWGGLHHTIIWSPSRDKVTLYTLTSSSALHCGSNRSFLTSLQAEEGGSVTNKQVHKWHNINSNIPIHVMLMTHSMFPTCPQDSPCLPRVIVCVTFLAVLINHWLIYIIKCCCFLLSWQLTTIELFSALWRQYQCLEWTSPVTRITKEN